MRRLSISPKTSKDLETKAIAAIEAAATLHGHDAEGLHAAGDAILCDLLNALGFTEIVKKFEALEKW